MSKIIQTRPLKLAVISSAMLMMVFAFTWRFYAMYWWLLFLPDLATAIFFICTLINSITFWIKSRNIFAHSYLPFCISMAAGIVIVLAPSINRSKSYYRNTIDMNTYQKSSCSYRLFIETYCVFGGGALGSDEDSLYLTDSTNFRLYLGTYDEEDGMITTTCKGDKIEVVQTLKTSSMPEWNFPKVVERKVYSLKDLKKKHVFD